MSPSFSVRPLVGVLERRLQNRLKILAEHARVLLVGNPNVELLDTGVGILLAGAPSVEDK